MSFLLQTLSPMDLLGLFFLLQVASPISMVNLVIGVLAVVALIAVALLVVMSKSREEVIGTETKRANSLSDLVKVRDQEISDLKTQKDRLAEELEDVTAELRTISAIKVTELMAFWTRYEEYMAERGLWEQKNRVLELQVQMQHNSNPPNTK
jgi:exosortase/archaeosortase